MDLGLILPLTNGGMVVSKAAPHPTPTFAFERELASRAESYGFEYALAQVTLRGFGGATSLRWRARQPTAQTLGSTT